MGGKKSCWSPSAVSVLSLLVFWGQMQNYMMRLNLSILIVDMAEAGEAKSKAVNESCIQLGLQTEKNTSSEAAGDGGKLHWDEFTRGLVLSSFAYGYLSGQIIGGRLTEHYGAKLVYGLSLVLSAVCTLLSPIIARWHFGAFVALRILLGVFESPTFPSLHPMTVGWVPVERRSSFIARSFFGSVIGNVVTFPLCGHLVSAYGWESGFYVIGSLTLVWAAFWYFFVFDTPEKHPRISASEKQALKEAIQGSGTEADTKPASIPWKSILTSVPFLALVVTDCSNTFGANIFFTNFPTYLKYMLGLDIKTNGYLSALPFLCRYLGGLVTGKLADMLYSRGTLSLISIRRVFNSASKFLPALFLVLLGWSGCDVVYAMCVVCAGFFFNGAMSPGHFSSFTDLAPNFSGTIFGISNTLSGGGTGFIVPLVIGAMTQGSMTFATWRGVFLMGAAVYTFGGLVYIPFVRVEPQPWNYVNKGKEEAKEPETIHMRDK